MQQVIKTDKQMLSRQLTIVLAGCELVNIKLSVTKNLIDYK